MEFVKLSKKNNIAIVELGRGKVNAINEAAVEQLDSCFEALAEDDEVRCIILTGRGKFFSFGFDIPEFMNFSRDNFAVFLTKFTDLYLDIFMFPKPVIAALNGHTIAGGCMLATACDHRIMVSGKAKISLNEITFGSSVFFGSVEILKYCVGAGNAQSILYSGMMYQAEEALRLGLIDTIVPEEAVLEKAEEVAIDFAGKDDKAFAGIKNLLRKPVEQRIREKEKESIRNFINIWYSEKTRENLRKIVIRD
jgi:enoyl-CoA hydratase/carnithine racemase